MTTLKFEGNDRDGGVVEEICGYLTSTPRKSFFLFAGAGSGKTRTLVEVLRRLTGVEPHETGSHFASMLHTKGQSIRVITYTRNAVAVINGRLGENDLASVSTIHAFCWDLIAGFDDDIRDALLDLNSKDLLEARQLAGGRKRGPTAKDAETIEGLEGRAAILQTTDRFIYHPDRNTHGEGALQHSQVLAVTAWLLDNRPTLRKVLADQHPVMLIDESQDTMKGVLGALMQVASEDSSRFTLGLLGDHRQRIYMDGHQDLPGFIPDEWARPKLEMNHRSQQRIVDLINRIWEAELDGRTQPATGIRQHARTERSGGFVRIYVGDASLSPQEKILRETRCAEAMAASSHQDAWLNRSSGYQVLALEHRLAAGRGGFLDVFNAMSLIDPEANRPQGAGDNTGPSAAQVLLRELPALAACVDGPNGFNEFDAIEVLNRYDRLSGLPTDLPGQQARLAELHEAIREFAAACLKADCTVREVLDPVVRHRLFEVDERLAQAFHDPDPPPAIPARPADESTSDRCRRGWHDLFSTRWAEVELYRAYLEGRSKLATHQVVKGSEFEHVMVIMDDHQASGFLFAYDKLFGAVSLSARDHENAAQQKETTIDRTLRLLYVTCSRARESLALVLWSSNPDAALRSIRAGGWFSETEIEQVPAE